MTPKPRILLLSPGFAAHDTDFNCIPPLQMLAQELQAKGVEVSVLTLGYPFHSQPYLWQGIPVRSGYGFNRHAFRWLNWLRMIRYALRAHRAQPFHAIHSFWLGPCWLLGRLLAWHWKIPQWTTLMGQDVLADNVYLRFLRKHHGPKLIALSAFQNNQFEQNTGIRAGYTIHWGIGRDSPLNSTSEPRAVDVLGCGALIPLKNWALWLESIALVIKDRPALSAVIIGDGEQCKELKAQAERLNISQNVHFCGHIPRAEVQQYMRTSKVFLHTSRYESFGFVLIEARTNGCHVLSTPVGVAPEMAFCASTPAAIALELVRLLQPALPSPALSWIPMEETAAQYLRLYKQSIKI